MRIIRLLLRVAGAQRGTLLLWSPVGLALGIGGYFWQKSEPGALIYWPATGLVVLALAIAWRCGEGLRAVLLCLALLLSGFLLAGFSANIKAAPVLGWRYYGPVEGRIIAIDRSAKDRPRITLDRVRLSRVSTERTPRKVRISLYYPNSYMKLMPGQIIMLTANLSPPSGPAEPGGFNFQRYAWFRSLGAIGYSRTPVLLARAADPNGWQMDLIRLRLGLADGIRARVKGQTGAFAAAILTGDRSAIAPDVLKTLRDSNLAHLLAISGLHMGLLTGFVFALLRYGIALFPPLALRLPVKKLAAGAAFVVAVIYLMLSGANVATQRAFVMVAVILLAVLLDRRALTLRAVAMAAVIVLVLRPESLIEAGFQMSFAATTALVAVFAALRDRGLVFIARGGVSGRIKGWALALFLSSLIAGLATAPISAAQFNRIAQFGLVANLVSVPAMGLMVMPAAVLAVLATPLGLAAPLWAIVAAGIDWILLVAKQVAGLDGAVRPVVMPSGLVLPLIAGGGLALILLRGRVRFLALAPILAGFIFWSQTDRPEVLLSANGRLLGVLGESGRWLNRSRGNGFVARNWLENDGDSAAQDVAAARFTAPKAEILYLKDGPVRLVYSWQKDITTTELRDLCADFDVVLLPRVTLQQSDCLMINAARLKELGSVAITMKNGSPKIIGARETAGQRLWSR